VRLAVVIAVGVVAAADVDARADLTTKVGGATVDWTRGMIVATGVGLADRHAPAPAVARAASRRRADDAGRRVVAAALKEIAWYGADPVPLAGNAPWIASRAVVIDASLEPDGSWRVTTGLPIEAIRTKLAGPRTLAADGDGAKAPTAFVVELKKADVVLGGGVTIAGKGGGTLVGPVLWIDRDPPTDLVGARPVALGTGTFAKGTITVAKDVPSDPGSAVIVVVVRRP
jgi:hypothetical protein